jgi:hypothetical protein
MAIADRSTSLLGTRRPGMMPALAALVAAGSLAGGLIGGTLAVGLEKSALAVPAIAGKPAATFDAVSFRAEERRGWLPVPRATFDAVGFRAGERQLFDP